MAAMSGEPRSVSVWTDSAAAMPAPCPNTAQHDMLRVDACDTCRRYLKTIDLTRLGIAVPVVDEVAGAPLDLWALERGYEKIELNLVGL